MDARRVDKSYDQYRLTVNSTELTVLRDALLSAVSPEADHMLHALNWYVERLPQPGEDKEDAETREKAKDAGVEQPIGAGTEPDDSGLDAELDALMQEPEPPGVEVGAIDAFDDSSEPAPEPEPDAEFDAELDAIVPAPEAS